MEAPPEFARVRALLEDTDRKIAEGCQLIWIQPYRDVLAAWLDRAYKHGLVGASEWLRGAALEGVTWYNVARVAMAKDLAVELGVLSKEEALAEAPEARS